MCVDRTVGVALAVSNDSIVGIMQLREISEQKLQFRKNVKCIDDSMVQYLCIIAETFMRDRARI